MKLYRQDLLVSRHTLVKYRVIDFRDTKIGLFVILQKQRSSHDDLFQKIIIITESIQSIKENYIKPIIQDYV